MIRRWGIYLAVLAALLGLYGAATGWITWIAVLTAAGSPLVSVAVSAILGVEDPLGLFRLPQRRHAVYDCQLRPYRPGDPLSRVYWKRLGKTGELLVRQEQVQQPASRKSAGILPVVLCFSLLFCLFPPWRYGQQMGVLQGVFAQKVQVCLDLTDDPRIENKRPVFDVVASQTQQLYLRGQTYAFYDGTSWRTETEDGWSVWEPKGTVTAAARRGKGAPLAPFYGAEEKGAKDYLQLPKTTRTWAAKLAEGKTPQQIQEFVRSCANYDETAVGSGQDIAGWLIESGGGYCVHFATTAAVLLRAAGIPARLVTGYTVSVQAGLRKTVTEEDAHAWVEFWDGEAWRILEATPTVEAPGLPSVQKENRHFGGWWLLLLAVLPLLFKKKENSRLKELRQKAAFSQYGLTEEEKKEKADILASLWKPKRERKDADVKQEEKKPITWEVADPKPPIIHSGKMEDRKKH